MAKHDNKAEKAAPAVEVNAVAQALAAPFDAAEVKFKPQTVSGNRALAVPFVDARVIQDRLDDVLGVMGWQDSYECLPDGAVVCRLKIRLGEEWITKEDVGGQSEQPDEGDRRKAAFSDALKRAAVKFGIGRYLYRQKPQWVDYDPQKRQFVRPPAPGRLTPEAGHGEEGEGEAEAMEPAEARRRRRRTGRSSTAACRSTTRSWRSRGCASRATWSSTSRRRARRPGFAADMTTWDGGRRSSWRARRRRRSRRRARREPAAKAA